ncbi:MAG: hypothetical protein ACLT0Y_01140 [Christensenellales bacterium]
MSDIKIVMTDMDGTYMENSFKVMEENLKTTRALAERAFRFCGDGEKPGPGTPDAAFGGTGNLLREQQRLFGA